MCQTNNINTIKEWKKFMKSFKEQLAIEDIVYRFDRPPRHATDITVPYVVGDIESMNNKYLLDQHTDDFSDSVCDGIISNSSDITEISVALDKAEERLKSEQIK